MIVSGSVGCAASTPKRTRPLYQQFSFIERKSIIYIKFLYINRLVATVVLVAISLAVSVVTGSLSAAIASGGYSNYYCRNWRDCIDQTYIVLIDSKMMNICYR